MIFDNLMVGSRPETDLMRRPDVATRTWLWLCTRAESEVRMPKFEVTVNDVKTYTVEADTPLEAETTVVCESDKDLDFKRESFEVLRVVERA